VLSMREGYEVVLMVGTDGGSIALQRRESSSGKWVWLMETNEVELYDLLDGEEGFNSRDAVKCDFAGSFAGAMALIDRYPWAKLHPMKVHPEYREEVLSAVRDRGGVRAERRWRQLLKWKR
jgi:hypothetical protein